MQTGKSACDSIKPFLAEGNGVHEGDSFSEDRNMS